MGINKISTIAASEDGDRIYCLYKEGSETMAKGFYDFNMETFILTGFNTNKLREGETPREAIMNLKQTLDVDMDWTLAEEEKIIKSIEEEIIKSRKRKRKEKNR